MAVRERLLDIASRQYVHAAPQPPSEAVRTWRQLRLAMVVVVVGLGAAVLYEHARTPTGCWQPSISAYYYTPVQAVLVGALVTIGVSLIAVQGNTNWEDLLLNLAGVCAPVVAFVPTPDRGSCGSVLTTVNRAVTVGNNITALLAAGGIWLIVAALLAWRRHPGRAETPMVGLGITVGLYLATTIVFALARSWFLAWGHTVAAILMFALVFLNVCLNAVNWRTQSRGEARPAQPSWRVNWYGVLAVAMAAVSVGWVFVGTLGHWRYWLLGIESSLIIVFAAFWALQTAELWDQGLRSTARSPAGVRTAATDAR